MAAAGTDRNPCGNMEDSTGIIQTKKGVLQILQHAKIIIL